MTIRILWRLLSVALLSGLVAGCDPDGVQYSIDTIDNGPNRSARDYRHDGGHPKIGMLRADEGQLNIYLNSLPLYAGPVTEAFIVDRVHPTPDGSPVLSFPGPPFSVLSAHLSDAQVRQMVNGDYALVMKTSSVEEGQAVGQTKPLHPSGTETQKEAGYFVKWSRPGKDGTGWTSSAYVDDNDVTPHARLFLKPPSDNLCWSINYADIFVMRQLVEARISVLDGKTAPVTIRFEPNTFSAQACLPASKAFAAALTAGHVQITITTAAVPAGEFVGPLLPRRVPRAASANPVF